MSFFFSWHLINIVLTDVCDGGAHTIARNRLKSIEVPINLQTMVSESNALINSFLQGQSFLLFLDAILLCYSAQSVTFGGELPEAEESL